MLKVQQFLDEVFTPRVRFRVNLSAYAAPGAVPLRWACMGLVLVLAIGIAVDLLDLWGLYAEVTELARSVARLQEQDRRIVEEAARDGVDLSATATTRLPSEITFVNRLIEKRTFSWTRFLSELEQAVPKGVGVSAVRLDPGSTIVHLSGTARSFEEVTAFLAILQEHSEFREPVLKQHADREDGLVEFQLTLSYRNNVTRS